MDSDNEEAGGSPPGSPWSSVEGDGGGSSDAAGAATAAPAASA
jgi:hypothetical protein